MKESTKDNPYWISNDREVLFINYRFSQKDLLDGIFQGIIGICFLILPWLAFLQLQKQFDWYVLLFLTVFLCTALLILWRAFQSVARPTSGLIRVDKKANTLVAKRSLIWQTKIPIDRISEVQFYGYVGRSILLDRKASKIFGVLKVAEKEGNLISIHVINTNRVINVDEQIIKNEVYDFGRYIGTAISKECGCNFSWKGFVKD